LASLTRYPELGAFLAGGSAKWSDLQITADELMVLCEAEDLFSLMYQRLTESDHSGEWPSGVRDSLRKKAHSRAGEELLRAAETRVVVEALARAGIRSILIKGTHLAYSWYDAPASRPRDDTDMLISSSDVEAARGVMAALRYVATVHCSDLFSQFEVQKMDAFGVTHVFDVHWKISTQPAFAGVLSYEELLPRTVPVPALGPCARAPRALDALLLACVHPVMHHRNVERVLWIHDIHLLATTLTCDEFIEFAKLAQEKRVAAICAHELRRAQTMFGTGIPADVMEALSNLERAEPSADYLAADRRWHDEFISSVRESSSFGERARLLRAVLFPDPRYMLAAYGLSGKRMAAWLLPALYAHRNLRGVWKIFSGHK